MSYSVYNVLQHRIMTIRDKGFTQPTDTYDKNSTQYCLLFKQETDMNMWFQVYGGVVHQKRSTKNISPLFGIKEMKFQYFDK